MNTFEERLKAGLQGEEILRRYLNYLGFNVAILEEANIAGWRKGDILVGDKHTEVKVDIIAAKTENICIEHQSLKDHTAPHYIWIIPAFYYVSKKSLESLVGSKSVSIGDDGRPGTLLPIDSEDFKSNFTKL